MDKAGSVGCGETIGNLRGDIHQLAYGNGIAGEHRTQGLALDQFADDESLTGFQTKIVDGDNVGVVEGGDRARFLLEAAAMIGAGRTILAQDFDGNIAVQAGVASTVDLSIPPTPSVDLIS